MGVPLLAPAAHLPEAAVVVPVEHRIDASEGRELPTELVCRQLSRVPLHLQPQEGGENGSRILDGGPAPEPFGEGDVERAIDYEEGERIVAGPLPAHLAAEGKQ